MSNRILYRSISCVAALVISHSAFAHHAATNFDQSRTITIQGTIKTFEWTNPHVWIWVTVPDKNGGEPTTWGIESANLSMARRMGMDKNSFKPGDKVIMVINPLRDGREGGSLRRATFTDGHVVDMGSPGGGAPPPEQNKSPAP